MIKDYVNEENLQVAMTEYDSEMDLDHVVKTQSGDQNLVLSPKSTTIPQEQASRFMQL